MTQHPVRPRDTGVQIAITDIAFPPNLVSVGQDREWCVVRVDGEWRKVRFHDYASIYEIPGLYESLFYEVLQCNSPATIRRMLERCLDDAGVAAADLRALDLGAGNGIMGQELTELGIGRIVAVDIIDEAARAARRDRPGVYEDYLVADMVRLAPEVRQRLSGLRPNLFTCVAALGFADIPPAAFVNSFNLIEDGGWLAFNIKSDFLEDDDPSGFSSLVRTMLDRDILSVCAQADYRHRLSTSGKPLLYTAIVGRKQRDFRTGDAPA